MGRYIHWGLEQAGHTVKSVGPYSQGKIPWNGGMELPERYWYPPTIATPDVQSIPVADIFQLIKEKELGEFDLLIQAADSYYLVGKAPIPNMVIATDPHVVDYSEARKDADYFVTMQQFYHPDSPWLPYGYDPEIHLYLPDAPMLFDVCFIGLQYDKRMDTLRAIHDAGFKVYASTGDVYDEYVMNYNFAPIAFNWSSQNDLPARFWEGLAMRRVVLTNRVPDLKLLEFKEDEDYLAFSTMDEAIDKVKIIMNKPHLLDKIAESGYRKVRTHTYANHLKDLFKELKI